MEYPRMPRDPSGKPLPPDRPLLVLLTRAPGGFEEARRLLREVNVDARLLEEKVIRRGEISFFITLIANVPLAPPSAQPPAPTRR
jgi:hypothetical protein